jgi:hypothetical protein
VCWPIQALRLQSRHLASGIRSKIGDFSSAHQEPNQRRSSWQIALGRAAALAAALLASCPAIVTAQTAADRETARMLMDRGDEQLEQGDLESALAYYRGAHQIMRVPTTGIELARCFEKLGKLVEARDVAVEVLRIPEAPDEPMPFKAARVAADQLASELKEQIPRLKIEIAPGRAVKAASVTIDGAKVPVAAVGLPYTLNPGEHRIELLSPGFEAFQQSLVLGRAEQRTLRIELHPLASAETPVPVPNPSTAAMAPRTSPSPNIPSHSSQNGAPTDRNSLAWPVWLGIGVGGAGILTGAVAGIISLRRASQAKSYCEGNSCTPAARSDRDAAMASANVSNVGFVVGAIGATVAVAGWWFLRPSPTPQSMAAELGVDVTPNGGQLRLRGTLW